MRTKEKDVIWIIVPVYNVEKVLHKCIKSIYKQTYTSWKLILVDDGSTDRSGRMCDMYAEKDSRIFTIHTINGGPHVARVKGISSIDNEGYCCFCDSDDEMPPDALQILYKEVKRTNADFVCGNIQRIYKGIKLPINSSPSCFETPGIYEKKDILSNLYLCCFGGGRFPVNLVGKLYKTNIIKTAMLSITKYPKCFAEDLNVTMHLLPKINRCSVISDVVYNYRIGGGTSRFMPTFLDDNILMYRIKMDMADQCTSELDVKRLVGVELKNIIVSYWIMCE